MANTLPDVQLAASVWTEMYSTTGIPVGTPLILQNKITSLATVQIRATMPVTTTDGYSFAAGSTIYLSGSLSGVWLRCTTPGRIVVMVDDQGAA